jgi:electron transport complex protein RnfC
MDTPIPDQLVLSLTQHKGPPAVPVVEVGEYVEKGQRIAIAKALESVPVHAPTSGTIDAIEKSDKASESAHNGSITIIPDGKDIWRSRQGIDDYKTLNSTQLNERILNAGISGLGGAGFSTAAKFGSGKPIELLIINAAECEPYITADQALIRQFPETVVSGAKILQYMASATRCVIVLENDKVDAIEALTPLLESTDIELITVPPRYPSGSEKQLIQMICGKQVPAAMRPQDIGVIMANAGTAAAVHDAIVNDEPLISRVTTLCGGALKTPKNFRVLLGTPVSFLLKLCGVEYSEVAKVVIGGSLMGYPIVNLATPVTKTTNCIIAGSYDELPSAPPELACIRCGYCSSACPVSLMPQNLHASIKAQRLNLAQEQGLQDCIECGICSYVCPSHIPLVEFFRDTKIVISDKSISKMQSEKWRKRFEFRNQRLLHNNKKQSGKSRRRSVSTPGIDPTTESDVSEFSRPNAQTEIAAAVARVKKRKAKSNAPKNSDGQNP